MPPALSDSDIRDLLAPYVPARFLSESPALSVQLSTYLDLLLRWNTHTNLTAIRDPAEIVRRHFGESLFAGLLLPQRGSLLDLGSGAGFPGIPIQLVRPDLRITLAESQAKKAAFLREAIRVLNLGTEVWPKRAEALDLAVRFDAVALRAVDRMDRAVPLAAKLAGEHLCVISGTADASAIQGFAPRFTLAAHPLPALRASVVLLGSRTPQLGE